MQALSDDFLAQCPVEDGFRLRGENLTRIEVFIDAAFAFAVTMLVISFDRIPQSFDEIIVAIKGIPGFIVAVVQLVWIWHAHSQWSQRYGLRDAKTVALSTALLIVVLIYIYPMRIMLSGLFSWLSGGYLTTDFQIRTSGELASMFVFLGCGFVACCLVFLMMYWHAIVRKVELKLSQFETYTTETSALVWSGSAVIGVISIVFALTFPPRLLPFAGFGYALLGAWIPLAITYRVRSQPGGHAP
jgi:uncharacterized membrane protein